MVAAFRAASRDISCSQRPYNAIRRKIVKPIEEYIREYKIYIDGRSEDLLIHMTSSDGGMDTCATES